MSVKIIHIIFLLFLTGNTIFGQETLIQNKLQQFVRNADRFYAAYPDEKVYLHLDNNAYFLEEDLHFKAYVTQSPDHHPGSQNNILYVELLSPEGNIVKAQKLKINRGQAYGEFHLDSALYSGFFEIRAYTRTMLSFRDSVSSYPWKPTKEQQEKMTEEHKFFEDDINILCNFYYPAECPGIFSRVFPVYERPEVPGDYTRQYLRPRRRGEQEPETNKKKPPFKITFYPESGHLVEGILSRVAFKVTTREGRDIPLTGAIVTSAGDTVTTFSTIHRGMGYFPLQPMPKEKYAVSVKTGKKEYRIPLPPAEKEGYILSAGRRSQDIFIRIEQNAMPEDTLGLVLISRGKIRTFAEVALNGGKPATVRIKQQDLPPGVCEAVLFNREAQKLCERKIFIRPSEKERISISVSNRKKQYLPQEKINLRFTVSRPDSVPCPCTFSVAVRDSAAETGTYASENILSYLLLTSEIRGFIPQAAYYFEKEDPVRDAQLDLLMMVQGWTRCPWENIAGLKPRKLENPEKELAFTGTVMQPQSWKKRNIYKRIIYKPWEDAAIALEFRKDSILLEGKTKTDKNGNFRFSLEGLTGEWKYLLSVQPPRLSTEEARNLPDLRIALNTKDIPGNKVYSYYEKHLPDPELIHFFRRNDTIFRNINLEEVVVTAKKSVVPCPTIKFKYQEVFEEVLNLGYPVNNARGWTLGGACRYKTHLPHGTALESIETFSLHHYEIDSIYIHTDYDTRKKSTDQKKGFVRTGFVNGYWDDIPLWNDDVDFIPDYVITYTKKTQKGHIPLWGTRHGTFSGITPAKAYYTEENQYRPLPPKTDYRRVLYWNPMVRTDSAGQAEISFYNNSTARQIKINAETIGYEGYTGVLTQ